MDEFILYLSFWVWESPRSLRGGPHLRLLAMADKQPELAVFCDQIGAWPNCHQRDVIQHLMKKDAEAHSQTLGEVLESYK